MSSRLQEAMARSKRRRELLALQMGVEDDSGLRRILHSEEDRTSVSSSASGSKMTEESGRTASPSCTSLPSPPSSAGSQRSRTKLEDKEKEKRLVSNSSSRDGGPDEESAFEESVYRDSSAFLKGTHSANPHNDYCQHFVDTGQRPQNFIRDASLSERFEEYPKLRELMRLKEEQLVERATPPMHLHCDLETFDFSTLGTLFDVILVDPPLEEYQRRVSGLAFKQKCWSMHDVMELPLEHVGAVPSFVFLWCGSAECLDLGRQCLKKWGYRRCEDICWIKTNKRGTNGAQNLDSQSILQHTKEHCLMGIRGTVRRATDTHLIHANVDLDLIISDEPEYGSTEKPEEIFHIIEHFCLGRRRLHIFASDSTIRPGWLSIGPQLSSSNFQRDLYLSWFQGPGGNLLGYSDEIEQLRPKSPPPKNKGDHTKGAVQGGGAPINFGPSGGGMEQNLGDNRSIPVLGGHRGGALRGGRGGSHGAMSGRGGRGMAPQRGSWHTPY